MTTESRPHRSQVGRAAAVAAGVAGLLVTLAAVLGDASAARGAAVGGVLAVGVFALGAGSVDVVSRVAPGASLMFALITYTFQVVVMALAFVVLNRSGLLDAELDRTWLGAAIIVGAVVWIATQLRVATTARILAFEDTATRAGATTLRDRSEGGAR